MLTLAATPLLAAKVISTNAMLRPDFVTSATTRVSSPITGRWKVEDSCTVVIGKNPPRTAEIAITEAVSAAAIIA